MFTAIVRLFWGDLEGDELKKFVLLALGFFFLIGPYWLLKTLKDSIFVNIIGTEYQPYAKILSLGLTIPLILAYSKLVDYMSKERMVYFLVSLYGGIGLIFVYYFYCPHTGLANTAADASRAIGWFFFLYVESYISLMISLYWAFINDVTTPESAKKGYGLVIFGSQLGGLVFTILGQRLAADHTLYATRAPLIALIAVCSMLILIPLTFYLHHSVKKENFENYQEHLHIVGKKADSVGFMEGLRVICSNSYVFSIFGLVFFYEFISTIMDFQMKLLAKSTFVDSGMVNKFFFDYALAVQIIACLFGLVGTSFFQRRFGIKFCIVVYPLLLGSSILCYLISPSLQTIFYVMLIAKAINYAFNQPAKEALYIPTSKSIKYKSKAWSEMFGVRLSESAASMVNKLWGCALGYVGCIAMSVVAVWILLANLLGHKFQSTVKHKKLIE